MIVGPGHPGMVEHHGQVDVATEHGRQGLRRLQLGEAALQVRRGGGEPGQGGRHQDGGDRGRRREPEPARAQGAQCPHLVPGGGQPAGGGVGMREQPGTRLGQGDTPGAAHDQRQPQFPLQALDVADRGLGPPERGGGRGQRAAACHLAEDQQPAGVDLAGLGYRLRTSVHNLIKAPL